VTRVSDIALCDDDEALEFMALAFDPAERYAVNADALPVSDELPVADAPAETGGNGAYDAFDRQLIECGKEVDPLVSESGFGPAFAVVASVELTVQFQVALAGATMHVAARTAGARAIFIFMVFFLVGREREGTGGL
jgi:hypothetical protein